MNHSESCFVCGNEVKYLTFGEEVYPFLDGVSLTFRPGYGSAHDGNRYRIVLCDKCIEKAPLLPEDYE